MPAAPYWQDDPDAWDKISIAGSPFPGLAKVKASSGRKIDVKPVRGRDGARMKDAGYENAKIDVEIRVSTKADYDLLQPRIDAIHPRQKGTARNPVDVAHPSLSMIGIASAYVTKIHAPEIANDTVTIKIEMLEWTPQPRSRPRQSGGSAAASQTFDTTEQSRSRGGASSGARARPPATP
jgi:hypothetical protein